VRLAKDTERIHAAGAEVMAISVNELERQVGMRSRWRLDDQLLVSDPGGETYLQSLGLFDPEERGGIALPGLLVITPDGSEAYRYQGRDFADRTTDDEMYAALEGLGLPAVDTPAGAPDGEAPEDLRGFFTPEMYGPYFRGNMFASIAIGRRIDGDSDAKSTAKEHQAMAAATVEAWDEVRKR